MKSRTPAPDRAQAREALELLDGSAMRIGGEERKRLRGIIECDRLGLWENDGAASYAAWLSARHGMSNWRARREIEAAYALEKLPQTAAALSSGALHLDKVLELSRFATPETEEKLIKWARKVSPAAIRRRGDMAQAEVADAKDALAARHLRTWWRGDGSALQFEGLLPAPEGMRFKNALDRLALSLPDMPCDEDGSRPDEETTMEQKRADALALMASAQIATDQDPDRATVVVVRSLGGAGVSDPRMRIRGWAAPSSRHRLKAYV